MRQWGWIALIGVLLAMVILYRLWGSGAVPPPA